MNRLSTAVVDVRLGRKRFSISGSLLSLLMLLVLVTLVTQTSARPQAPNETTTTHNSATRLHHKSDANYNDDSSAELAFDAGDDYADVDNVEWHHVKIVDGVMHEDHPIIMYKEDFVSEDYDPSQHATTNSNSNTEIQSHPRRKYKNIKRQNRLNRTETATAMASDSSLNPSASIATKEKYHALKPEKIYFDILPQTPVVLTDDSSSNDSKFEPSRIHVEVISLLDEQQQQSADDATKSAQQEEQEQGQGQQSKHLLNKHPKKYHHHQEQPRRLRRDLTAVGHAESEQQHAADHKLHKRTPHYIYERQGPNSFDVYAKHLMNHWTQKHAVAGNRWNGIDGDVPPYVDLDSRFGGEENTDRVIWGVSKKITRPTSRPIATRRPAPSQPNFPPIIHNSNPEDADYSGFNTGRPQNNFINNNNNDNRRPAPPTRPPSQQQFPSIFHNSNPNDADFSLFTKRPPTATARPLTNNAISTGGGGGASSSSSSAAISQCVWAIVNCCSTSDSNIRYECFGRLGCPGAFWNLNPCADDVKDKVLEFVDRQFQ